MLILLFSNQNHILSAPMSYPFWSTCLQTMLLLCVHIAISWFQPSIATTLGNETDFMALVQFKESISTDPYGILTSWNSSSQFCNWHGITCNKNQRVVMLNLQQYQLHGTISPHIGNLSFLTNLNLQSNSFYGEIPSEFSHLFRLQELSLSSNALTGEFPVSLRNCSELRHLNLSSNGLYGKLPTEIGSFKKLEKLYLVTNNFTGQIPPSIGNLSSLNALSLRYNNLEGKLPEEIGQLKNLLILAVVGNKLTGMVPSSLYNMSSLALISLAQNQFHGSLPAGMFSILTNLQKFGIGANQITGTIPTSITNASLLQLFDIGVNNFVGQVPNLGKLKDLNWLNLNHNNLGTNSDNDLDFITPLVNCTNLAILYFNSNKMRGVLPNSIGNLSGQLSELDLSYNKIHGTIPATLGNHINLISLNLESNYFIGSIPDTFGKFRNLQQFSLAENQLSGKVPIWLENLTELYYLSMANNMLEGKIPPTVGNLKRLQLLDLSGNNLSGTIPLQLFSLFSLSTLLNLSHNSLNGTLPAEVGAFKNLGILDISRNNLFGEIPATIGGCTSMEILNLQGNSFSGEIPSSVASLTNLVQSDLSENNFSGSIPTALQNLSLLTYLNLSFNMLDGEVPTEGVFKNASVISVAGNKMLCGGISELHLAPCPIKKGTQSKHHKLKVVVVIICVVVFLLLLSSIFVICWRWKQKRLPSLTSPTMEQHSKVSYQSLHHATEGFSSHNMIGSGSFGSVYKGFLESEDKVVAIKVINLQKKGGHKSFIAECNALQGIRHRNLVKILTCCSSIDYRGQEFKALVFKYMSNGSLEKWLHPSAEYADQSHELNLAQRLNILVDVAFALHYLHYECEQPIIHCDLKPSNVLLDDDMVAHVSDFGLAKLLSTINGTSPQMQSSTIGLKGTIGYAPPEYGIGSEVSTQGDMYSFGILVLEMLTGRRPTEEMFKDGESLHNYVKLAYPNNLLEILDSTLLPRQLPQRVAATEEERNMEKLAIIHTKEEMCTSSLIRIGLACSMESPKERMDSREVIKELNLIKNAFICG